MKKLLPFLLIPVFLTYGPNAVGYKTIIDTTLDDPAIERNDLIVCNVLSEYGDHRLIEGKILFKEPFILLVSMPILPNVPLPMSAANIEFCVVSGENK